MGWLTETTWSPYAVGAGIGVLSWFTFLLIDRPIGCSTAFARGSGMIRKLLGGTDVSDRPYYRLYAPVVDWQFMLVIGLFIGAFVSAIISGSFDISWEPAAWAGHFGHSPALRMAGALLGGTAMGFGARWAGGCTSGHGISGTMQWAVSSWMAVIFSFAGGIATAWLLFDVIPGAGP